MQDPRGQNGPERLGRKLDVRQLSNPCRQAWLLIGRDTFLKDGQMPGFHIAGTHPCAFVQSGEGCNAISTADVQDGLVCCCRLRVGLETKKALGIRRQKLSLNASVQIAPFSKPMSIKNRVADIAGMTVITGCHQSVFAGVAHDVRQIFVQLASDVEIMLHELLLDQLHQVAGRQTNMQGGLDGGQYPGASRTRRIRSEARENWPVAGC